MARRTLTQAIAETVALKARREKAAERIESARLRAKAPRPPSQALAAFSSVMDTYAERVAAKAERLVVKRLEGGDIFGGLAQFELELRDLASNMLRSSRAAARRASDHARSEAARVLNLQIPKPYTQDPAVDKFVRSVEARLLAAAQAQADLIRGVLEEGKGAEGVRQALWLSRQRSQLVARDSVYGLQAAALQQWSQNLGSEEFYWSTSKDERVRPGHAALDGRKFRWDDPPNTGRGEGANLPGQARNCRCKAVPVEVVEG